MLHSLSAVRPLHYPLSICALAALLGGCGGGQPSTNPLPGEQNNAQTASGHKLAQAPGEHRVQYILEDIGTFGGPSSEIVESEQWLLPGGTLSGWADTPKPDPYYPNCFVFSCYVAHAFLWNDHTLHDLGTLPHGASSETSWINRRGDRMGTSQNGVPDQFTGQQDRAVLWRHGEIQNLGTLGGTLSSADGGNDSDEVEGIANNTVYDPHPIFPGTTQTRAFLWKDGHMRDLGTLGGTDAFGQYINNRGQVAGFSYTTPGSTTVDPFLWSPSRDGGHMVDLGGFGGTFGAVGWLNDRGEVVGSSNGPGDQSTFPFLWRNGKLIKLGTFKNSGALTQWINERGVTVGWAGLPDGLTIHAVIWKNTAIKDLGSLPGEKCAFGYGINSKDEVVGTTFAMPLPCFWPSSTMTDMNAVLWQNGAIVNLNDVVPENSTLHLAIAFNVDDRGDTAGVGVPPGVGFGDVQTKGHAFVLIPCKGDLAQTKPCGDVITRHAAYRAPRQTMATVAESQRAFTPIHGLPAIRAWLARRYPFLRFSTGDNR